MKTLIIFCTAILLCVAAPRARAAAMRIGSSAFVSGHALPQKYTCSGANVSPALFWKNVPKRTKSLALIVEDPDAPAGVWTHWMIYNIPASARGLPAHVPPRARLADGSVQGMNSFGKTGYDGPCPPYGHAPHRYYFSLYALDTRFHAAPDATAATIKTVMKGHVLAVAKVMGRYGRSGAGGK